MKAFEKNPRASLEMSECPEGAQVLGGETDLKPSKRIRLFSFLLEEEYYGGKG